MVKYAQGADAKASEATSRVAALETRTQALPNAGAFQLLLDRVTELDRRVLDASLRADAALSRDDFEVRVEALASDFGDQLAVHLKRCTAANREAPHACSGQAFDCRLDCAPTSIEHVWRSPRDFLCTSEWATRASAPNRRAAMRPATRAIRARPRPRLRPPTTTIGWGIWQSSGQTTTPKERTSSGNFSPTASSTSAFRCRRRCPHKFRWPPDGRHA